MHEYVVTRTNTVTYLVDASTQEEALTTYLTGTLQSESGGLNARLAPPKPLAVPAKVAPDSTALPATQG